MVQFFSFRSLLLLLLASCLIILLCQVSESESKSLSSKHKPSTKRPKLEDNLDDSEEEEEDDDRPLRFKSSTTKPPIKSSTKCPSIPFDDEDYYEDIDLFMTTRKPKSHHHHVHVHKGKRSEGESRTGLEISIGDKKGDSAKTNTDKPKASISSSETKVTISREPTSTTSKPTDDSSQDDDSVEDYSDEGEYRTTLAPNCQNKRPSSGDSSANSDMGSQGALLKLPSKGVTSAVSVELTAKITTKRPAGNIWTSVSANSRSHLSLITIKPIA